LHFYISPVPSAGNTIFYTDSTAFFLIFRMNIPACCGLPRLSAEVQYFTKKYHFLPAALAEQTEEN